MKNVNMEMSEIINNFGHYSLGFFAAYVNFDMTFPEAVEEYATKKANQENFYSEKWINDNSEMINTLIKVHGFQHYHNNIIEVFRDTLRHKVKNSIWADSEKLETLCALSALQTNYFFSGSKNLVITDDLFYAICNSVINRFDGDFYISHINDIVNDVIQEF